MLICCHRGYHADVPENTLDSFEQAVSLGFDGIETDVRVSADGQAILYHSRLAPGGREVSSMTLSELRAAVGYAVPTLDEALDGWGSVLWILEIKRPEALPAAYDVLRRFARARRLLVISFWHSVVEQAARMAVCTWKRERFLRSSLRKMQSEEQTACQAARLHGVECGLLLSHQPSSRKSCRNAFPRRAGGIDTIVWNYEFLDEELVRDASARGYSNFAYGPESRAEHEHCARLNLTGVITDYPQFLLPAEPVAAGATADAASEIHPL